MLLMHTDPAQTKAMSSEDLDRVLDKHEALRAEMHAAGELVNGAGLAYPEETTTISLQGGEAVRRNGPLSEAQTHVTAYYVVDCPSRERALKLAERILDSHVTDVEVREVHDWTD